MSSGISISVMLAVNDAQAARRWYVEVLGAEVLWDLGGVVGLRLGGAPFFIGQPSGNGWEQPSRLGLVTARVEVFTEDPEGLVRRALDGGASGSDEVRDHRRPWGLHRQGGFTDPFGHIWLVGDHSPLGRLPG